MVDNQWKLGYVNVFEKNHERTWCYHAALMVFINEQLFTTLLSLSDPFHAIGHTATKFAKPLLAPCGYSHMKLCLLLPKACLPDCSYLCWLQKPDMPTGFTSLEQCFCCKWLTEVKWLISHLLSSLAQIPLQQRDASYEQPEVLGLNPVWW